MTPQEAEMLVRHIQKLEEENQRLKSLSDFSNINRFELINHTGGDIPVSQGRGRIVVLFPCPIIEFSIQDEGRTLKIFITNDTKRSN